MTPKQRQLLDDLSTSTAPDSRIDIITQLVIEEDFTAVDKIRSLELAEEAVALVGDRDDIPAARACVARAFTLVSMHRADQAFPDIERGERIFLRRNDEAGRIAILLLKGRAFITQADFQNALASFTSALESALRENDRQKVYSAYEGLGATLAAAGGFAESHEYAIKALEIAEELGDEGRIAGARWNVAHGYHMLGQPEVALQHLLETLEIYSRTGQQAHVTGLMAQIANIYRDLEQDREADEWANRTLALAKKTGARIFEPISLCLLAGTALKRDEPETALAYARRALRSARTTGVQREIPCRLAIGEAYRRLGNISGALRQMRHALRDATATGNLTSIATCHYHLVKAYGAAGDHEEANRQLEYFRRAQRAIERETTNRIVMWTRKRMELEGAAREAEEIRRRAEEMAREIRSKERELAELAHQLRERREMLTTIDTRLAAIERKATGTAQRMIYALRHEVQEERDTTAGWQSFAQRVDETHLEFVRRLSCRFPALTKGELKICTLLRVNLSSQEIASLLGISRRSVESYRYRIHKKLILPQRASVVAFLSAV